MSQKYLKISLFFNIVLLCLSAALALKITSISTKLDTLILVSNKKETSESRQIDEPITELTLSSVPIEVKQDTNPADYENDTGLFVGAEVDDVLKNRVSSTKNSEQLDPSIEERHFLEMVEKLESEQQ